jgi:hypothetical protein
VDITAARIADSTPGNPRVKQNLRQFNEHALGVLIDRASLLVIKVGNPEEAHGNGPGHRIIQVILIRRAWTMLW